MQTIITKFLGPTNHKGSRVMAKTSGGQSVTVSWDYALSSDLNHQGAVRKLVKKLGWNISRYAEGSFNDGSRVWVPMTRFSVVDIGLNLGE